MSLSAHRAGKGPRGGVFTPVHFFDKHLVACPAPGALFGRCWASEMSSNLTAQVGTRVCGHSEGVEEKMQHGVVSALGARGRGAQGFLRAVARRDAGTEP